MLLGCGRPHLGGTVLSLFVLVCGVEVAVAQTQNPAPVTTLSDASHTPVVAPNSLASLSGTQFSTNTSSASPDKHGHLPSELGGTTVEIGGRTAPLLFVSPRQVRCLIPADVSVGVLDVVVKSRETGFVSRGKADVRAVAPGLYSLDGSGSGAGAIVDAMTNSPDPFPVRTDSYPGADKRTRVAVFATGIRYAGNTERLRFKNVAASVQATAIDTHGVTWPLAVEYAGPTPEFAGLDQLTLLLPTEADGLGIVNLSVTAQSQTSNAVSFVVRNLAPPEILTLSRASAPPGAEITITGHRFAAEPDTLTSTRNRVVFRAPDGSQAVVPPLRVDSESMAVIVPPIPVGEKQTWYEGSAGLCVVTDGQSTCRAGALKMEAGAKPAAAAGDTLLAVANRVLQESVASLNAAGDTAAAQALDREGQANLGNLRSMISDAAAGRPRTVSFVNVDGRTATVAMDLASLQQVESLMVANANVINPKPTGSLPDGSLSAHPYAWSSCGLAQEKALEGTYGKYNYLTSQLKRISEQSVAITVGIAVAGCVVGLVGGLEGCLIGAAYALEQFAVPYFVWIATATWPRFVEKIWIEAHPNFLDSIETAPASVQLERVSDRRTFAVQGKFFSLSASTIWMELLEKALTDIVFNLGMKSPANVEIRSDYIDKLLETVAKKLFAIAYPIWKQRNLPPLPGTTGQAVELSQRSIDPAVSSQPSATVTVACTEAGKGDVLGLASTNGKTIQFPMQADNGNLLQVSMFPPKTQLGVCVGEACGCPAGVSGTWTGSGGFPGDEPWPIKLVLTQQGANVSGDAYVTLPCMTANFTVSGTVQGNIFNAGLTVTWYDETCAPICSNPERYTFTFTGTQMTGTGTGVDCIGNEPYTVVASLQRQCSSTGTLSSADLFLWSPPSERSWPRNANRSWGVIRRPSPKRR